MKKTNIIRRTLAAALLASLAFFGGIAIDAGSAMNQSYLIAEPTIPSDKDMG